MSYTVYLDLDLVERGATEWHDRVNGNFVKLDTRFGPAGHSHTGVNGQGPQLPHSGLMFESDYVPVNTHEDIDDHIADTAQHPVDDDTKIIISNLQTGDPTPVIDDTNVFIKSVLNTILDIRFPRAASITNPTGNVIVVDLGSGLSSGTGPAVGVPTHLPTRYAPVASVDHFTGMTGRRLSDGNWLVAAENEAQLEFGQGEARIYQTIATNGIMDSTILHRVKSEVPHCEVQRASIFVAIAEGGDATDRFGFQLALMASSRQGLNTPCRLGVFLKIEVVGTTVTRSLYSVAAEPVGGISTTTTWWTDTGTANGSDRNILGVHEISIDREHRLHYYYNNSPITISGGQNDPTVSGALTATIQSLIAALSLERSRVHPPGTGASYLPVSPKYGRFGFDVYWTALQSIKYSFSHFAATSTDDENEAYLCMNVPDTQTATIPATLPRRTCCTTGDWAGIKVGDYIDLANAQFAGSSHPSSVRRFVVTDLIGQGDPSYFDGDPTHVGGFLVAEVLDGGFSQRYAIFCDNMDTASFSVNQVVLPRTNSRATIEITAARLPSLLLEPEFFPVSTTEDISPPIEGKSISSTYIPSNTGQYAVPIPFPDFSNPNEYSDTSVWGVSNALNGEAITNISYSRETTGKVLLSFDVGDLPPGAFLSLRLVDALRPANILSIPVAVPILPNKPEVTGVRIFSKAYSNSFEEQSSLQAGDNYIVITGRNFPVGVLPVSSTLWSGYPITGSVDSFEGFGYALRDKATNEYPTFAAIESLEVHKGTYFPLAGTWTSGFGPTGLSEQGRKGVTAFLKISVTGAGSAGNLVFRMAQLQDVSLEPTDLHFVLPDLAPSLNYFKVTEGGADETDADANTKILTVYADNFNDPVVASVEVDPGSVTLGAVTYLTSPSRVTMNVTTPTGGDVVIRLTNDGGSFLDVGWDVDGTKNPAISSIAPSSISEGVVGQTFVLACSGLEDIDTSPLSNFAAYRVEVYDSPTFLGIATIISHPAGATGDVTVVFDVPGAVTDTDLTFKVINPNGNYAEITCAVVAATSPTISSITNPSPVAGADGFEPGTSGVLSIAGTDFLATALVTSNSDDLTLGSVQSISSTSIQINYSMDLYAVANTSITITVDNQDGSTVDTYVITVSNRYPTITSYNLASLAEGELVTASVYGNNIYKYNQGTNGYESNIDDVEFDGVDVGSFTTTRSTDPNTPFAGIVNITDLQIPPDSAGSDPELSISTDAVPAIRTGAVAITITDYLPPVVTGIVLKIGSATVSQFYYGETGYTLEIYGLNFPMSAGITLGGAIAASTLSTPRKRNKIVFTGVDIDAAPLSGIITLTVESDGNTSASHSFDITLAVEVPVVAIVVDAVDTSDLVSGGAAGALVITGSNLELVADVAVTIAGNNSELPLLYTQYGASPASAQIISKSSTQLVVQVTIGPLLGKTSLEIAFIGSQGDELDNWGNLDVTPNPSLLYIDQYPSVSAGVDDVISAAFVMDAVVTGSPSVTVVSFDPNAPGPEENVACTYIVSNDTITVDYTNPSTVGVLTQVNFVDTHGQYFATFTYTLT